MLRAALAAGLMGVTGVAACVAGDRSEPLAARTVAHVFYQRPGPVERRRTQVIGFHATTSHAA